MSDKTRGISPQLAYAIAAMYVPVMTEDNRRRLREIYAEKLAKAEAQDASDEVEEPAR